MQSTPGSLEQEIADLYARDSAGILQYAARIAENRDLAHDAVQEAFFRFFLCRSAGQQIRSPKAWLLRVARNYILDQKKTGARHEVGVEWLANLPCPPHPALHDDRLRDALHSLNRMGLSPREIECVRLRAQDLRYEEIAGILGLEAGTVGALLTRAHGKIRKAMSDSTGKPDIFAAPLHPERRYAS